MYNKRPKERQDQITTRPMRQINGKVTDTLTIEFERKEGQEKNEMMALTLERWT